MNKDEIKKKFKYLNTSNFKRTNIDEKINKHKFILKKVAKIMAILVLSVLLMFIFLNIHNLGTGNVVEWTNNKILGIGGKNKYPVQITGSKVSTNNFTLFNNNLAVVSDTSFIVLNKHAKEILNEQHSLNKPVLKVSGNKAILYNSGATAFQIQTTSKKSFEGNADYNIISGSVSSSGRYAVVTESKNYLCELSAFDRDNKELYKYYFSEYYITDVSISENGKVAAVSGFSSEDGKIKSIVYVFDFTTEAPKATFEYDETAILSIGFLSDKKLVAIGDNLTSFIKVSKQEKNDYSYDKKTLTCFEVNPCEGVTMSLSATTDKRNCKLIKFKGDGKIIFETEVDFKVESISSNKNRVALLSDGKIISYSFKGKIKGKLDIGNDSKKVQLNDSNTAYVLGMNEIKTVNIP